MKKHDLLNEMMIDQNTFHNFTKSIQDGYKNVTYHNKLHGADVCQTVYYFLVGCDMM
jgi:hypothetical protein